MSKLAWERAAGSAAKLATISVIAALAATTSLAANSAAPVKGQNAKVPASYGQPQFGAPTYGQPQFNAPAYGQAQVGAPVYGQPLYGQPRFGAPVYGQPNFGAPVYGQPPLGRQQIAPATTSTFKPSSVTSAGVAPKLPLNAARPAFPAGQQFGQRPVAPQFGQRIPIFANTQANGITYGPPSYTPPKDFDPKTASSSPFPSDWHRNAWGQQQIQGQRARFQGQGRAPLPNLAGAPVYGNAWGQNPIAPASVSRFAPAEPSYAPAEPLRPNYTAAAPVYAPAKHAPAAPAKYESVDLTPPKKAATKVEPAVTKVEPASTPTYSYDIAPSTAAPSYVGQSTQISSIYAPSATPAAPTTNPYEVVIGQSGEVKSYDSTSTAYQPAQAYEPAPVYQTTTQAPAYQPAPAPAYQPATPTPAYQAATPAPAYQASTPAPAYQAVTQAPAYQAATPAPAYESAASTYQAAPAYEKAPSTYQAAPAYESAASKYQAAPAYETAAPAYETAVPAYQSQTSVYEAPQETAPAYQAASSYSAQGYETVTAAPAYEPAPAYETAAPAYTDAAAQLGYNPSSFSSGSDHFVQVGAFRNLQRAERLVRKLQGAGEQPIITQANVRGKLYHRVRVPAADRRDASNVQSRIRGLGYYEARTVRG